MKFNEISLTSVSVVEENRKKTSHLFDTGRRGQLQFADLGALAFYRRRLRFRFYLARPATRSRATDSAGQSPASLQRLGRVPPRPLVDLDSSTEKRECEAGRLLSTCSPDSPTVAPHWLSMEAMANRSRAVFCAVSQVKGPKFRVFVSMTALTLTQYKILPLGLLGVPLKVPVKGPSLEAPYRVRPQALPSFAGFFFFIF